MDRHYTYEEVKKAVFSNAEMNEEMLEHLCVCEECMNKFVSASQKHPVRASVNSAVNVVERVAIKKQERREMTYNMRVVFGVIVAVLMVLNAPMPSETKQDVIRKNYEEVTTASRIKEELREDLEEGFDKFMEFYTKGIRNNDKTEK
ncbi:MAG: hypothetical protein IKM61_01750 [Eubacteriaceae bacterium]|nr:hypothetical protein [Eubacteriaceae bacterium]